MRALANDLCGNLMMEPMMFHGRGCFNVGVLDMLTILITLSLSQLLVLTALYYAEMSSW